MNKRKFSILIANTLDHFDANLYSFMAPIMAPLFFPKQNAVVQLILAYSFLATSSVTRPLGVLLFGYLAKIYDPWKILQFTLIGVGLSTMAMGFLPTYASMGPYSVLALLAVRVMGGIFAEGEKTIASLFFIEDKKETDAITMNAWLGMSIIAGCMMASYVSSLVHENTWRIPFMCGGLLAFYALLIRTSSPSRVKPRDPESAILNPSSSLTMTKSFFAVVFSGALYYMTYDLSFIFIPNFVPLVTKISKATMMSWNNYLFIVDMLIFIPIAQMAHKLDALKIKKLSVWMLALPSIPIFYFMQDASLLYILLVRLWIIFWGVVFSCVYTIWLVKLFPHRSKYLWIGIGMTIGTTLIGRSTTSLCLWGWYKTGLVMIPGLYLFIIGSMFLLTSKNINRKREVAR